MTDCGLPNTSVSQLNMDFVDKKMYEAFGVTLIRTTDIQAYHWNNLWLHVTKLCGKLYALLGCAVGRHFVESTATELNNLAEEVLVLNDLCFYSQFYFKETQW